MHFHCICFSSRLADEPTAQKRMAHTQVVCCIHLTAVVSAGIRRLEWTVNVQTLLDHKSYLMLLSKQKPAHSSQPSFDRLVGRA